MYPIVFQALHDTSHSASENVACKVLNLNGDLSTVDENHAEDCAVCDYQFFVNDVPQPSLFVENVEDLSLHYFGFCTSNFSSQVFVLKSPRAPPALGV